MSSILVSGVVSWLYGVGAENEFDAVTVNHSTSIAYLRAEFPSECWDFPEVATTITHSLERFFVGLLPRDDRIEHVFWFSENETLKVWTVIPEPDFSLEEPLYKAQIFFIEKTGYECDFSVIYRFGKSVESITPQGSRRVF